MRHQAQERFSAFRLKPSKHHSLVFRLLNKKEVLLRLVASESCGTPPTTSLPNSLSGGKMKKDMYCYYSISEHQQTILDLLERPYPVHSGLLF